MPDRGAEPVELAEQRDVRAVLGCDLLHRLLNEFKLAGLVAEGEGLYRSAR